MGVGHSDNGEAMVGQRQLPPHIPRSKRGRHTKDCSCATCQLNPRKHRTLTFSEPKPVTGQDIVTVDARGRMLL